MKSSSTRYYNFYGQKGLSGGLNVSDDPLIVGPEEMAVAKNVLIGQSLSRQKRPGLEDYHTGIYEGTASYPAAGTPIRGIIQYWRYGSGTGAVLEDVFLHQSSKLWSLDTRTSPGVNRTGALVLTTNSRISYQVFEGILYFCSSNTSDGYNKWNGLSEPAATTAQAATAPPDGAGKYLGIYIGRMVMGGNPDFPFRVYLSAPLDADNWTLPGNDGATSFDLSYDGDPEGITAIFPEHQGKCYIATRRSIYELSGVDLSTFSINRVSSGVGCIGQGTVVATPNDILFASDRGLHSLNRLVVSDQSAITFQSKAIQKLWVDLLNTQILNQSQAAWDENLNLYVLTCPSSGQITNDTVLCYNMTFGYWTTWDGINARALNRVLVTNKQYVLAGTEAGKVAFLNPIRTTDFGTGFTFQMKSGKFFPDSNMTNQYRFVSVTAMLSVRQPSSIAIGYSIDSVNGTKTNSRSQSLGTNSALLGSTFVLGQSALGTGAFIPVRFSIEETGYNFQLEITATGNSDINFLGWILEVEDADPVYT